MLIKKPSDLIKTLGELSVGELMGVPDIGPKVSASISDWFQGAGHQSVLRELDKVGINIKHAPSKVSDKFKGQSFVITGVLESMSREEAENRIRRLGGDPSGSVSKKTDYVIAGENPGSKLDRAERLGVKIISEKALMDMLS